MAQQISACMVFYTDPADRKKAYGVKQHPRCVLYGPNRKQISVFSPGVKRADKLVTALWRRMIESHHVAWGNQLRRWQNDLERAGKL
jgi:hypothetical protein